jgi:hypothetical protein
MVTAAFHFSLAPVIGSNKKQTSIGQQRLSRHVRLLEFQGVRDIRPLSVIFRVGLIGYICQSAVCWRERELSCSSCDAILRCEVA